MLYFIFVWTFLIINFYLTGTALLNVLKADFKQVGDRFILAVWLGVIVLAISLLATSIILPLSPLVGTVIILSISFLSLLLPSCRAEIVALKTALSLDIICGFFTLELGVAALTTRQVTWIDTGLYHYGFIKWLSEFGAVPGVALLLSQFGFTSSWFALAAPLNAEIFADRVSAVTNGFAFLITVLHLFLCLAQAYTNKARISDWFVIIFSSIIIPILLFYNLMSTILVSPSPDLPIVFLIEVVAWAILIISNQKKPDLPIAKTPILDVRIVPLLLSAGAVTIKLIAIPLLFISSIFYVSDQRLSVQRVLMVIVVVILLLSPMFVFGIITSGCPLFPSSFLCLNLPWSPSAQEVKAVSDSTHNWVSWYASPSASANSWLGLFWKLFSDSKPNEVMALLIVISTVCGIYIALTSKNSQIRGQIWLIVLAASGVIFLISTAPFVRFELGYLLILPAFSIAKCSEKISNNILPLTNKSIFLHHLINLRRILLTSPFFLAALIITIFIKNGTEYQLLLPPQLPQAKLRQTQVNNIKYFSPNGLCWAAELPCTFEVKKDIRLRDPKRGIKAGFVVEK